MGAGSPSGTIRCVSRSGPNSAAVVFLVLVSMAASAVAQAPDANALAACAVIDDPATRLACFDRLVPRSAGATPAPDPEPERPVAPPDERPQTSLLGERWSIGAPGDDLRFDLRAHRPSYFLLGRFSDSPNRMPSSPSKPPLAAPLAIDSVESKFQLSFKVRLAEFDESIGASLWAGYTQQSQWQVYNGSESRPFRETNYEPELMLAFHPDRELAGWRWRLLVVGLNHQSNGRGEPLSRSWNRVYAQFGVEKGNFGLLIRPWWRIPESDSNDDNPDLTRYLGHGDVVAVYRWGRHTLSALGRFNVSSQKGALQLGWSFPLARRLNGYIQGFTGYGESLIDYNVSQSTIGIGISLADHL